MQNQLRRTLAVVAGGLTGALGGCPSNNPNLALDAAQNQSSLAVTGTLAGKPFVPRDAIVVRLPRKKGRGDIAWVALSSAPDACAAYLDGSLELELFEPRQHYASSELVVWTVFPGRDLRGDLKPGPIAHAIVPFEGKSPLPPTEPGPFGFAQASHSDDQCDNDDIRFDYPRLTSEFAIDAVGAPGEPLQATVRLAQGDTDIHGTFIARPCQPPPDWRPAEPGTCRAAPDGPKKTVTELLGPPDKRRFFPMGEPTGVADICWETTLACVLEKDDPDARVRSVEVTRQAFRAKLPISDGDLWVSHARADGNGGALVRAVRTEGERTIYDLGGDSLSVDKTPAPDGTRRATYTTKNNVETKSDALVCAPIEALGDHAKWRYSSSGACPAP